MTSESKLRAAALYLSVTETHASWEYPGFIKVPHRFHEAVYFAIGDANGFFEIDIVSAYGGRVEPFGATLPLSASVSELIDWISYWLTLQQLQQP